jgi:NTE family protein
MRTIPLFFLSLFLATNTFCQSNYKNLIFEGAGIRGLAYAGVIQELESNGTLKNIEKVGGTSAGAIIATAVALGYNSKEIENLIYETKFQKFNDGKIGGFSRTFKSFGYHKGNKFSSWIGEIIKNKTGSSETTFGELHSLGYKDLSCVATLLDQQKMVVYNAQNYPKMKIKDAVRASMSIPFYFRAMIIDDNGKTYKKLKHNENAHIVCDGGIIGNFPIQIYDTIIDGKRIPNIETIGVRIDIEEQISSDQLDKKIAPIKIKNIGQFTAAFYNIVLETANRTQLNDDDWKRTISVSSGHIGPKIKKLEIWEKDLLLQNGQNGVKLYFDHSIKKH